MISRDSDDMVLASHGMALTAYLPTSSAAAATEAFTSLPLNNTAPCPRTSGPRLRLTFSDRTSSWHAVTGTLLAIHPRSFCRTSPEYRRRSPKSASNSWPLQCSFDPNAASFFPDFPIGHPVKRTPGPHRRPCFMVLGDRTTSIDWRIRIQERSRHRRIPHFDTRLRSGVQ